jgi:hypothetical protein
MNEIQIKFKTKEDFDIFLEKLGVVDDDINYTNDCEGDINYSKILSSNDITKFTREY